MKPSKIIKDTRIITVSGRIASGSTTLAKRLAQDIGWRHIEGGEIFWEAVRRKMGLSPKETNLRPDEEDALFDSQLKTTLSLEKNIVLETKLAGFNAQGISEVFKILVICEDESGKDCTGIRIDRLVNREGVSINDAKEEVLVREKNDLDKWRKMYANNDMNWAYYNPKYYDLIINTYSNNQEGALQIVLSAIYR
ncbi:cytidylate kinase [Candidatus Levyibacteriota bacterium]|nr:cytidylate kinase [Candidatus Levybacteria bacterium]